jgi:DNA polymerase (family 10)
MPAYDNAAIAAKLELMADLLEIAQADRFRVLSYRKAAGAIRAWPEQAAALANTGRLCEIPGVGAKMAVNIEQVVSRGSFDALDEVAKTVPPTLAEVTRIPGVGPKRAARLAERLGVATLEDLERELASGAVARLGGFGDKTAEKIAAGLDAHRRHRARVPIGDALPAAEAFLADVCAVDAVERAAIAGSVRRREETVGNIDLVVQATDRAEASSALSALPAVEHVLGAGANVDIRLEMHDGLEVRVYFAQPDNYGAALRYYTGSVAHNAELAAHAAATHTGPDACAPSEEALYGSLGMQVPPPEIRWGSGEVALAAAGELPELVTLADVRGDLQSHSTYTDGKTTLEQNQALAAQLGYEYFAATDHAYALRMVGGLSVSDLERQWAEIDELNARGAEQGLPRILKGIELNVGPNGELDYDDDVLARFEIVLASMHSGWDEDEATATRRIIAAISHPLVDVIAHPTGRVIGRRDPIRIDVDAMLEAAGETGTIMEINSYPDRLDLSAEHIRLARSYGVRFSLGTDAHSAEQMRFMPYGVAQARRGLVTASELLNAQPWDTARTWLKRYRSL